MGNTDRSDFSHIGKYHSDKLALSYFFHCYNQFLVLKLAMSVTLTSYVILTTQDPIFPLENKK